MPTFRLATPDDFASVCDLYRLVLAGGSPNASTDWSADYPTPALFQDDLENGRLYVYERDGALVGFVSILPTDGHDAVALGWREARSCSPSRLCVHPGHQGQGLGQEIMERVAGEARTLGYHALHLLASTTNRAANRLYAKLRFDNLGPVRLYERDFFAFELVL